MLKRTCRWRKNQEQPIDFTCISRKMAV